MKLQTLAVRYYIKQSDNFDAAESQMRDVAESIRKLVYMDQKELVRVAAVKSLASLIPLMSVPDLRQNFFFLSACNYESYLLIMSALILVLTDENPEIRLFIVNQGLHCLFKRAAKL